MLFALAGIALLVVIVDELAESEQTFPSIIQAYYSHRNSWQDSSGDEFSGEVTAFFFGASIIPLVIDLILRALVHYVPIGETVKKFIRRINRVQRKYLMPFHTYLSILALGCGILHLTLSTCAANPLPEFGLIITSILVTTGLLFKWYAIPKTIRKVLYQFHTSLIISGILLLILYTGHAVMVLD
jgi:hypothetical protein